jgi:hypothetical protein
MYNPTGNEDDYNQGWEDAIDSAISIVQSHGANVHQAIEALYGEKN